MTLLDVFVLSVIEGITEFLPVSSTAHLYISQKLLNIPITPFVASFTIIIQVGALIGTALYMYKNLKNFTLDIKKIVLACIPTLFIGFIFYKLFKAFLVGNMYVIAASLVLGAFVMLWADYFLKKQKEKKIHIANYDAFVFGVTQALSIIPGVSRSGAVLVSGYFRGFDKKVITQFSFLIGLPVAYTAALYDIYKTTVVFSNQEVLQLILGIVVSGFVSYFCALWFLKNISKVTLKHFAWYRILLGASIFLFLL